MHCLPRGGRRVPWVNRAPFELRPKLQDPVSSKPDQHAQAFKQSRGVPETRIRRIAKENGVAPQTVKIALREFWGPHRYRREIPPRRHGHKPQALVALMNDPKIQESKDLLTAAAKRLGIKRQSLMSILSRKGVRRDGGRYVRNLGGNPIR